MNDADPVVRLDRVARSFGDVRALDGVTLTVGHGEVVGLLGHNGAGKTTTVRLLTGILSPMRVSCRCWGWIHRRTAPACAGPPGWSAPSPRSTTG